MSSSQSKRVSIDHLESLVQAALLRAGMAPENVGPVAATIVACERDGVKSHGILRLPGFVHSLQLGWADGRSRPAITGQTASLVSIDAANGFAQVALDFARPRLLEMAEAAGVAVLLTKNSHHFAALWPDIEPFASRGLVALTCVNSKKRMAAWGGGRPVTGTNAIAFATPRPGHPPLVWDQSSSVLSQGDVLLAANEGRAVPAGIGCDAKGQPTTSPSEILDGGALLPFGGSKGASLAVMVEILAAALTGGRFGFEDQSPPGPATTSFGGQFLLLINPGRVQSGFDERVSALVAAILDAGASRLPGDRRYRQRQISAVDGIVLDAAAHALLLRLAGRSGGPVAGTGGELP
ncbi:Ldh family oxidoreductase [Phreatobacter stygius]|uniref:Ldh family oxidoreductase n=1 Tax=Phreatobacter stygius TaxID=1940610 RepID=A0A4D7BAM7_9HYPH|nr:Ldh family oxidoreductase [Phreatobacter stygius]QCI65172.1 Ldh family oxidoreductase [Phreatobacter stygius]